MRKKSLLAALLGLPLVAAALMYGRDFTWCHRADALAVAEGNSDESDCCSSDSSKCGPSAGPACCAQEDNADAPQRTAVQSNVLDEQVVFTVEGLCCPAVKGIGCGHMLRPVLASLDKIEGVQASSANYTGTMIRVAVTDATERARVAAEVRKVLTGNKPVALAGDELKLALETEQWRETWRIGELSAIEFRTLILFWINKFAQAEKLDNATTDRLTRMADHQWERVAQKAKKGRATEPQDWENRCREAIPAFLARAGEILTDKQVESFKKTLAVPCGDQNRPEAPPPGIKSETSP